MSELEQAITLAGGLSEVAKACNVSYQAVQKWILNGLPRTEWTGETMYSDTIAQMQNEYTAGDLLSRKHGL